ncbi:MAG: 50S ribosomal protein L17 [Brevinemataceae bacterium]
MRHGKKVAKLSRTKSARSALFRNLAQSFFKYESIKTTLPKAKALRPYIEKLVTKAKSNSLHNRRLVLQKIYDKQVVSKLFENIAPRFLTRNGGYLRIIKLGQRQTDGAEMAIVEFVDSL